MDRPLAIMHGTLIDGTGAPPLPDSVVVVRDQGIEVVGSCAEVTVPADAEVINATGKTSAVRALAGCRSCATLWF